MKKLSRDMHIASLVDHLLKCKFPKTSQNPVKFLPSGLISLNTYYEDTNAAFCSRLWNLEVSFPGLLIALL